ncbi:MAG: pyruvate kinase [Chloroflexota bacterium]
MSPSGRREFSERFTKLHVTVGPSTRTLETLHELIAAGANGFRVNSSHTDAAGVGDWVGLISRARNESGKALTIRLDVEGPRVRCSPNTERLTVGPGDVLAFAEDRSIAADVYLSRRGALKQILEDDVIEVNRGAVGLRVLSTGRVTRLEAVNAGEIGVNCAFALRGRLLDLPFPSRRDRADMTAGIRAGVDLIGLSCISSVEEIERARAHIGVLGSRVRLLAKIETAEALGSLSDIVATADAVSISRGDLDTVVIPAQRPSTIARIASEARKAGRPVQVAGRVLGDWNATGYVSSEVVADLWSLLELEVDGLSLSDETAISRNPVEAVQALDRVVRRWERTHVQGLSRSRTSAADVDSALALSRARIPMFTTFATPKEDSGWLNLHWGFPRDTNGHIERHEL